MPQGGSICPPPSPTTVKSFGLSTPTLKFVANALTSRSVAGISERMILVPGLMPFEFDEKADAAKLIGWVAQKAHRRGCARTLQCRRRRSGRITQSLSRARTKSTGKSHDSRRARYLDLWSLPTVTMGSTFQDLAAVFSSCVGYRGERHPTICFEPPYSTGGSRWRGCSHSE